MTHGQSLAKPTANTHAQASNTHNTTKYRNTLQIHTTQPHTQIYYKYTQPSQIQKRAKPNTEMCFSFTQNNQTQKHTTNAETS